MVLLKRIVVYRDAYHTVILLKWKNTPALLSNWGWQTLEVKLRFLYISVMR